MAKSKLNYNKTIVSKMTIKGILSEDGKTITYFDEDDVEREIKIMDCFALFAGKEIDIAISEKASEDLEIEPADEDEDIEIEYPDIN